MMNRIWVRRGLSLGLMALLAGGCVSLTAQPDRTRYFLLSGPVQAAPAGTLRLGVERVEVPSYLDSRKITLRKGDQQILHLESSRWAQDFDETIRLALQSRLLAHGSVKSVDATTPLQRRELDVIVEVKILTFEGDVSGQVDLAAEWTIRRAVSSEVLARGDRRARASWKPDEIPSLVAAMSGLINDLTAGIGTNLVAATKPPESVVNP